ncbi:MAG: alpha/beta fold hydrolase [Sphingomonas oligoaromativorans]
MAQISGIHSSFGPIAAEMIEVDGLSVRVARDGAGSGTPILLTAPWPESIFAFHAVWQEFRKEGPIVAVDLPGFGRSEGRPDLMSPARMGDFLITLLDALGLDQVHAVVPDVGTLAALYAAADHPERFKSIIAGCGGTSMDLLGEPLKHIVNSTPETFAGVEGGAQIVSLVRQFARITPPDAVIEDYRLSSLDARWNEAANFVRAYKVDLPRLAELLPLISTPVLVISGKDDPFVPSANGEFLEQHLQNCKAVVVDAGHFVWEDAPDDYAALATDWIRATHGR